MKYVLDTNIFNWVLDGRFSLETLSDTCGFVATKIQFSELEATRNLEQRAKLLSVFSEVAPEIEHASFSYDIKGAGYDEGQWREGDHAKKLWTELEAIKRKPNNWQDALIAEVALHGNYCLVTADKNLSTVATHYGIKVHYVTVATKDRRFAWEIVEI